MNVNKLFPFPFLSLRRKRNVILAPHLGSKGFPDRQQCLSLGEETRTKGLSRSLNIPLTSFYVFLTSNP